MRTLKYIIGVYMLLSVSACKKDFLEVIDKTVLLKEGYVVDLETTGHYLNGVYADLAAYYVDGTYLPYPEIMADNMKPNGTNRFIAAYNWSFTPAGLGGVGEPTQIWTRTYPIIRSCSFVIEKADEYYTQNPEKAKNTKGQALAIRAMLHFYLANVFAQSYNYSVDGSHLGIPYVKASDIDVVGPRLSVNEVYTNTIEDLNRAVEILPKTGWVKERMNYEAARALLSRIYLFKENYQKAKEFAVQVLKDVPLEIANYPSSFYTDSDAEALFHMPPGASTTENYSALFMGYYASATAKIYYLATNDITQLLRENPNDKRNRWIKDTTVGKLITKFPRGALGKFLLPDGDYNQTLFRSSEMALNAAEAFAKLNIEDSARYYIDLIRKRANPSVLPLTATGPALLDTIYKERRKEMCFDGLRMWDLLRWKKDVKRSDINAGAPASLVYPNDKAVAAIPTREVQLGMQQNPGY